MAKKSLDDFLSEFGNPGRCQLLCSLIIIVVMMQWTMVQQFNFVVSYIPDHHCKLPSENWNWTFNESIPKGDLCHIYSNPSNVSEGIKPCPNGYDYLMLRDEIYPTNEFDMVCNREYLFRLSLTLPYVGVAIGGLIFGYLSDVWGRKKILNCLMPLLCGLSVAVAYAPNLVSFIFLRFILGAIAQGVHTVCITYMSELFRRQMRTVTSYIFGIAAAVLLPVQSYMMYFLLDWRTVQLTQGALIIISVITTWFLPESVTWLISKAKLDKCEKILSTFAKFNNIPISPTISADLLEQSETIKLLNGSKSGCQRNLKLLFCNSTLRKIMLAIMFMIFTNACVMNGLSFSISGLEGDLYLNYLINGGIQIVIVTVALFLFSKFGRVKNFLSLFISSGLLTMTSYLVLHYYGDVNGHILTTATIMALISRNLVSATAIYISTYAAELLPTIIRATGVGIGITAGRLGNTLSPQILYRFKDIWVPLPHVLYGSMSLLCGVIISFLPETFNKHMPNSLEDVENLMNKKMTDEERPLLGSNNLSKSFQSITKSMPGLSPLMVNQKLKLSTSSGSD